MELRNFIDNAFDKYEDSPELIDFKEELLTNLHDRLKSLEKSGLKRIEALREIEIEFADINKIADEMSLDKKKEIFEVQYMSFRHFITKPRAAIYTILGMLSIFGMIMGGGSFLITGKVAVLTSALLLFAAALAGLTYMGLTQETSTRNPMRPLRAAIYAIATFVLLYGVLLVPKSVLNETISLENALAILIPFALPSIGVLSFLMITESEHRKSWVLKEAEKQNEWAKNFESSGNAQTFGIITAGIWILAIGASILLLILQLWIYSWIPLVVAFALMMFFLAHYMKKSE